MTDPIDPAEAHRTTIESYNRHLDEYVSKDVRDARTLTYWPGVQFFLDNLRQGEEIFEVGSGTGSDALRIEKQGFSVQRSDISEKFIERLEERGYEVSRYDVLDGPTSQTYSAVFANAVLLHFTPVQFRKAVRNLFHSLNHDGILCIGMKLGDFEGWREKGLSGKRYFKYWGMVELETELVGEGFQTLKATVVDDSSFTMITLRKSSR